MFCVNDNPESISTFSGINFNVERYCKDLDIKLSQYDYIKIICNYIGCRPSYLLVTLSLMLIITVAMGYAGALICNLIGFIYPAYMSFKAIETPDKMDDKQWLTYWVVYAIFNIVEAFTDLILFWIPFYYLGKLCFLFWLFLPEMKGAEVLYLNLFRPILLKFQNKIDKALDDVMDVSHAAKIVAQRYSNHLTSKKENKVE
ncbi:TB2 HVA22 family protein [Cryptosporidium andersoni]|uniref:TB2 HVA22 family protein n=1 Tax=Cryptosporidium andersoni TaxID=117008 RepID=A0A1J4MBD5_9CRYT|nr:TB2 HVA22 family protein [Cryptosporidium andersoni]